MDFFNVSDLDFFSSVIGKKYAKDKASDQEFKETGKRLTEQGVHKKTDHWARLLKEEGFPISFKYHWQNARRVRKYTWAQIYLPAFKDTQIYFTVGVGSRRSAEKGYVSSLEYKLDCQRKNGLSPYQIQLFDNYLNEFGRENSWKEINKSELSLLDWNQLKEITLEFIEEHEEHYKALVNLVWPNGVGVIPKIARVCWNKFEWKKPSGPDGKSVSKEAFEKDKGYGYEEWLFDLDKQVDGYHYGFLQAFNKGDHEKKVYDVQLYTIENDLESKSNKYYWVGRFPYLEVLSKEEKDDILKVYKENGWYEEMLEQLKEQGISDFNFDPIPEEHIFNVKFKVEPGYYERFNPMVEITNPKQQIGKNRHYVLLDKQLATEVDDTPGVYVFKEGHIPAKTGTIKTKPSKRSYKKTLLHQEIQTNIYKQLTELYKGSEIKVGTEVATGNGTSIDLVVNDPENGDVFYEIKTGSTALGCIREAMGQIIEYCYYSEVINANKLIIVSPHRLNPKDKKYLSHLRNMLNFPIQYQRYSKETKRLESDIY